MYLYRQEQQQIYELFMNSVFIFFVDKSKK